MKRTVFNLFLLILTASLWSFTTSNNNLSSYNVLPVISFESQVIDYGDIAQYSNGLRTFEFQNTGNAPLLITNVKTSCGCTIASYSKDPIGPRETGEINVKYNTNRLGAFTKSVVVTSNTEEVKTILKIKGNVVSIEK